MRMQEALAGDEDAIAEVWATYLPAAKRVAFGVCWGIDDPDQVAADGLWTALAALRAEAVAGRRRAIKELRWVSHETISKDEICLALLLRTSTTVKEIQRAFKTGWLEAVRRRWTLRHKLRVWIQDVEAPDHFGDGICDQYLAELAPGLTPEAATPGRPAPCDLCLAVLSTRVEMLMRYRLAQPALTADVSLWNAISAHPVLSVAIAVLIAAPEVAVAIR